MTSQSGLSTPRAIERFRLPPPVPNAIHALDAAIYRPEYALCRTDAPRLLNIDRYVLVFRTC